MYFVLYYNQKETKGVIKMTIETIITQLDRISDDADYTINGNHIRLIIDDFEGFDEHWSEIEREFVDEDAVDEILEWLEKNADYVDGNFYRYYHFGDIVVKVGYTSFDI